MQLKKISKKFSRATMLPLACLGAITPLVMSPAYAESPSSSDRVKYEQTQKDPPTSNSDSPGATMGQTLKKDSPADLLQSSEGRLAAVSNNFTYGLDVSSYQPNVNWFAQRSAGARFAYIKATEGTSYTSPVMKSQYAGATNAGIIRGAYHFALPSVSSGADQANRFVNAGGGWSADGQTLPGLLDMEYNPYSSLGNTCYNMSGTQLTNWILDFSNTYKSRTGRYPAMYSGTNWLNQCSVNTSRLTMLPLHLAAYNGSSTSPGSLPSGFSNWDIWQYTDKGVFAGDSNRYNGSESDLRNFATNASYKPIGGVSPSGANGISVKNGIGAWYNSHGGQQLVGMPTMNERGGLINGGVYQQFSKNWTIYWSPASGTHAVNFNGGIGSTYRAGGYENRYGYPVSEETYGNGVAYQWFKKANGQLNLFMWTPSTGTHVINESGGIGNHWANTGREDGSGVPAYGESYTNRGGAYQGFKKWGHMTTIIWTAQTGAHSVYEDGAIASAWSRAGRENGSWGFPVTDEYRTGDGKVHQRFSGGVEATWSPTSFSVSRS